MNIAGLEELQSVRNNTRKYQMNSPYFKKSKLNFEQDPTILTTFTHDATGKLQFERKIAQPKGNLWVERQKAIWSVRSPPDDFKLFS